MREIKNVNIVLEDDVIFGNVTIYNETIETIEVLDKEKPNYDYLIPGFIDVHIHGGCSFDAMDAKLDAIKGFAKCLTKEGTTSFLPTTMTQSTSNITKAVKVIGDYYKNQNPLSSKVLGIHLEGPYISKHAAGAQPVEYIKAPEINEFMLWQKASGFIIKKVSLAPENEGSLKFIRYLKDNDIIPSIAHTVSNYQTAKDAIKAGASSLTHFYNAMTPLHHRDIGVVGAGFLHHELSAELIFDKIHVSVDAAKILFSQKGIDGVILITDAMRNKGLPEGISELGGQTVYIKGKEARLKDGTLAGSISTMIDGYKNLVNDLGLTLYEASRVSSLNAAKSLKLDHQIGSIKKGKIADLVILDSNLKIKETIVSGLSAYKA